MRPNQCQCRQKFHKNEAGICVPTCDPPCLNGICVSPNVCKCDDGFKFVNFSKNRCEPACEKPCENGYCSGINECTCWEGWSEDINDPYKCTRRECRNGLLDGDYSCLCGEDQDLLVYDKDNMIISECVDKEISACGENCIDFACPVEDSCECEKGYRKATMDKEFKCIPVCEQECVNGKCVAPNQCQCLDGFTAEDHNDLNQCSPVCDKECTHGYCSGPNKCTCNEGYAKDQGATEGSLECLPICLACKENEECVAPGQCECRKKNFVVTANGDCQEIICILGQISDDRCLCSDGFFLDETNTCREIVITTTEKVGEEIPPLTERSILESSLDPLANQQSSEEDEIYRDSHNSYTEREIEEEAETLRTESDMEIVPTTKTPLCINGRLINGKCTCSDDYIQMMDNECVARTTIEYKVAATVPPKIVCSEKCLTGMCHSNGTCKCPLHYKLSPEDETECVQGTVCEVCLNDDMFPCPPHCLAMEYSPSVKSKVPQYLIIILACFIAFAAVILFLVFYKRMKKHEYYTGPVPTTEPIYAYDMEVLT